MNSSRILITLSLVAGLCGTAFAKDLSPSDKKFVEEAAQGNHTEVMIGNLGLNKSKNREVLKISKRLVYDHEAANTALKKVMADNNAKMPYNISAEQQKAYEDLKKLNGKAFDESFLKVGLEDHTKDVDVYKKESKEAHSKEVRDYASAYLPKIEKHKEMFMEAQGVK